MSIASLVKELREKTGAGMMDCKKALEATEHDIEKAIEWLRENGIAKAAKKGDRVAAEGLTSVVVSGNDAVIFELNSETDFVAKNEQFLDLLTNVGNALLAAKVNTLEEALAFSTNGQTLDEMIVSGTATIGEKINLRRFEFMEKTDAQNFVTYSHMGGRISVLMLVDGADVDTAKQVAMHVAASNPMFLNTDAVDPTVIEKEREILTKEALNEGKPANIVDKMVEGRIRKYLEEIVLTEQNFVIDTDKKVKDVLANASLQLIAATRYEVGEGIEKAEVDFAAEVAAQAKI